MSARTETAWNLDPAHSVAEFKVRHMMISNVKGRFTGISGVLHLDEAAVENSRVEASIDAASLGTGDARRDAHLRSADFFDVEKFPALTFRSTGVTRKAGGELALAGELTIHGVTREVTLAVEGPTAPARDPWGMTRIGVSARTTIHRKDFGLSWNATLETGGILVGEEVAITLELEFVKAEAVQ
ncbi:MAG: YceI family protein [Bryobacteraceae bacterium]